MNAAAIGTPAPDMNGDGRWMSMHKRFASEAKEKEPEVIFIGDSLIQYMVHSEFWKKYFAPMHSLNFGIGGDSTQNVLWRIQNGELDNCKPKVVVLLVGTNNIQFTPEQVSEAVLEIVKVIREKQPQAYIVLPTLLPRGQHRNPRWEANAKVNQLISESVINIPKCQVVKIDKGIVQHDDTLSHHDMFDYLHLTGSGYEKCFEPVHELLVQLLSEDDLEKEVFSAEPDDKSS